jgi:hypothetical protein
MKPQLLRSVARRARRLTSDLQSPEGRAVLGSPATEETREVAGELRTCAAVLSNAADQLTPHEKFTFERRRKARRQ